VEGSVGDVDLAGEGSVDLEEDRSEGEGVGGNGKKNNRVIE
jgi:hypothetical protein